MSEKTIVEMDKRVIDMFFEICGIMSIFGFGYFVCKLFVSEIPMSTIELVTFVASMVATVCHFMKRLGQIFPEKKEVVAEIEVG